MYDVLTGGTVCPLTNPLTVLVGDEYVPASQWSCAPRTLTDSGSRPVQAARHSEANGCDVLCYVLAI